MDQEFWASISPDAWLQTAGGIIGAFVGTLLAGLISIFLYKKEAQDQRVEKFSHFKRNYLIYFRNKVISLVELLEESEKINLKQSPFQLKMIKVKNEEVKRYYLMNLEPCVPIELHESFEHMYGQIVNIESFIHLIYGHHDAEELITLLNLLPIMNESIQEISHTLDLIDTKIAEDF
ncbi:hypothetical protein Q7A53_07655 [Halobacillus rhizosphaerae]|uniref:hypothetical protein n=1 Tax=Halobacillus rhizosphaerae TaxID=3064889 RepID=UPI00398B688B